VARPHEPPGLLGQATCHEPYRGRSADGRRGLYKCVYKSRQPPERGDSRGNAAAPSTGAYSWDRPPEPPPRPPEPWRDEDPGDDEPVPEGWTSRHPVDARTARAPRLGRPIPSGTRPAGSAASASRQRWTVLGVGDAARSVRGGNRGGGSTSTSTSGSRSRPSGAATTSEPRRQAGPLARGPRLEQPRGMRAPADRRSPPPGARRLRAAARHERAPHPRCGRRGGLLGGSRRGGRSPSRARRPARRGNHRLERGITPLSVQQPDKPRPVGGCRHRLPSVNRPHRRATSPTAGQACLSLTSPLWRAGCRQRARRREPAAADRPRLAVPRARSGRTDRLPLGSWWEEPAPPGQPRRRRYGSAVSDKPVEPVARAHLSSEQCLKLLPCP